MNVGQFSLADIQRSLENLESASLKTSEDINDEIENLVECINSNAMALQRSLDEIDRLDNS